MAEVVLVAEPYSAAGFEEHATVFEALFVTRRPDAMIVVGPFMIDAQRAATGLRQVRAKPEHRERDDRQCFVDELCRQNQSEPANHGIHHIRSGTLGCSRAS